jgi:hypothetical protein
VIRKLYKLPDRVALNKKGRKNYCFGFISSQSKIYVLQAEKRKELKIVMKRENVFGFYQSGLPTQSRIRRDAYSFKILDHCDSDPTVKIALYLQF